MQQLQIEDAAAQLLFTFSHNPEPSEIVYSFLFFGLFALHVCFSFFMFPADAT